MRERTRDPELIVFGYGGHAKVILDILLDLRGSREILILDDNPVPYAQKPPHILPNIPMVHGIGDLRVRRELQTQRYPDAVWSTTLAHTAHIANTSLIFPGAQILHHAYIGPETIIGRGCIINNHASVDHDCRIGSFSHIAPGCTLCGHVIIGDNTLIGAGSVICPHITIGDNCIVSAGSRVFIDIPDNSIMLPNGYVRIRRSLQKGKHATDLNNHNKS